MSRSADPQAAEPQAVHASDAEALCAVLAAPHSGHLAVYRWLPRVWEPGSESHDRQSLVLYLRAQGWTLVSEQMIGDPVTGTLYIFRREGEGAGPQRAPLCG